VSLSESEWIAELQARDGVSSNIVALGMGDDAALLHWPEGQAVATSIDTLVAGVHFPEQTSPFDVGYKSLAVSLSDMAAMGARPEAVLMALTVPQTDRAWLDAFAQGFFQLAQTHQVSLAGGDSTRGPLCVSTVLYGSVPHGEALCRAGASVGDRVYVTGELGGAGLALDLWRHQQVVPASLQSRLDQPQPRVDQGLALRGVASAAIDVSDGLVADLSHLCAASQVGAEIHTDTIPWPQVMREHVSLEACWSYALSAGDDYELCFTVPEAKVSALESVVETWSCACHCVGRVVEGDGVVVLDAKGDRFPLEKSGYEHFGVKK